GGGDRSAMSSGDEQSDEETVPLFRPFTKESLAAIEARIAELNARKAERSVSKQRGEIGPDGVPEHYSIPSPRGQTRARSRPRGGYAPTQGPRAGFPSRAHRHAHRRPRQVLRERKSKSDTSSPLSL
ncbi:uncharacterized protein TNCV_4777531, partial [Trichonephila clavipes]